MRIVLIPQFSAKKLKSYIKRYKINLLVGVPTIYDYMTKMKFGPRELKRIKGAVSGGDMASQAMKEKFNQFLADHGSKGVMHNGYGLTEAAGCVVFSRASVANNENIVGFPLPDNEILIIDLKTGRPAQPGEDGEIVVRGPVVMSGYLDDPTETAAAFVKVNGKLYLRTGDIGYLDEGGAVYFKGRIKRMIITNGYNVYPSNIEDTTLKSSFVAQCACIGKPDELRGEIVKIFVVLKKDANEKACKKDLAQIYKKYLAKYEIPREIEFIAELPKTKLGKIDFMALKKS